MMVRLVKKLRKEGVAALRSRLKTLASGRAFAWLSRKSALFLPLVGATLSSTSLSSFRLKMVRKEGVEPSSLAAQASETCAYANSATSA